MPVGGRKGLGIFMKITREADYALRIVAMLAKEGKQVEAKRIAEQNDIPYRFTLKILRKIVQSGIMKSYRGVNGGYVLNKEPSDITFKEVIETIDGKLYINHCMGDDETKCKRSGGCAVQKKLLDVQNMISDELEKITLADVI